jgi:hypothetical protein
VICTSTPVRSSTYLSAGFNLPTLRSIGFGYSSDDFGRAHPAPPALRRCGLSVSLRLRPISRALASPSNETPWPVIQNGRMDPVSTAFRPLRSLGAACGLSSAGFRLFSPPSRGTFQRSLALLVHYRSRDVFRIGRLYLPASHAISNAQYSGSLQSRRLVLPTGLSPAMVRRSRHVRLPRPTSAEVHDATSPGTRRTGIRFVLYRFRSPLLTASRLISCPPPTRMLYFGGFPFLTESPLRERSSDSVIGGSQVPCAYPPLIAAWHDLPRRPSRAIPQLTGVSYTECIRQASRTRVIGVIGPRSPPLRRATSGDPRPSPARPRPRRVHSVRQQ